MRVFTTQPSPKATAGTAEALRGTERFQGLEKRFTTEDTEHTEGFQGLEESFLVGTARGNAATFVLRNGTKKGCLKRYPL
jgi:hypothetical protein